MVLLRHLHAHLLKVKRSPRLPSFALSSTSQNSSPPPTCNSIPRKAHQSIRRLLKFLSSSSQDAPNPDLPAALAALRTSPHSLSSSSAAAVVSAAGDPLLSFDFYRFLRCSPLFRPDSALFCSLLKTQLESKSPHQFRIQYYITEMRKRGISLLPDEFRPLYSSLFPERRDLARSFLDQLVKTLGPSSGIYGVAVSVLTGDGLIDEAVKTSQRARSEIEHFELGFYSSLMGLYRISGEGKAAMEAFLEMEKNGIDADDGIYRDLLRILSRIGWFKLAWVVLAEKASRINFMPDESLGLVLLKGFLKQGMISEAGFLIKQGIFKKKESFLVFVEAMVEKKMPLEAFEFLTVSGEPKLYAPFLILGCGRLGLIEEAEKIYNEIKSLEGKSTVESVYASMIHVYTKASLRTRAEKVFDEMNALGAFSGEACLDMMSMYAEIGLLEDVRKLFVKWSQRGVCLDMQGYAVMIKALIRAGKLNEARFCFSEMGSRGIRPSCYIYSLMMEGYLKGGLLCHADNLLEEYKGLGLSIEDGILGSNVAQILVRVGRYEELHRCLDGFARSGLKFPRKNGAILKELCRDGSCLRKIEYLTM